jgi:hypothetical protein
LPAGLSGNVAVYTDYLRGISQTSRNMALQGGFDFNHDSTVRRLLGIQYQLRQHLYGE